MKRMMAVVLAGMVCAGFLFAEEPEPLRLEHKDGTTEVGFDLWGGPRAAWQRTKSAVVNNPGKTFTALLSGVLLDRVSYNNDWLWYHDNGGSKPAAAAEEEDSPAGGTQTVQGETVVIVTGSPGATVTVTKGE